MLLVDGDPDCRSAGSFFKNPSVAEEVAERVGKSRRALECRSECFQQKTVW